MTGSYVYTENSVEVILHHPCIAEMVRRGVGKEPLPLTELPTLLYSVEGAHYRVPDALDRDVNVMSAKHRAKHRAFLRALLNLTSDVLDA